MILFVHVCASNSSSLRSSLFLGLVLASLLTMGGVYAGLANYVVCANRKSAFCSCLMAKKITEKSAAMVNVFSWSIFYLLIATILPQQTLLQGFSLSPTFKGKAPSLLPQPNFYKQFFNDFIRTQIATW